MRLRIGIAVLAMSAFAFAQHGGHGGGMGSGGGMGTGGGMGAGMGSGAGMSGNHGSMGTDMGSTRSQGQMGQAGQGSMGQARTPSDLLSQNTRLSSNLQKLLPQGMTPQQACSGFKNLGECVAAIHVSNNLSIPFTNLQSKLTGSGAESLGKAIKDLKPTANAKNETKKAKRQAKQDLSTNS